MHAAAIQFSGVYKRYGTAEVLHNVNLHVNAGEFVGLAGVNGAGKTTLIKCLLDFCNIDSGSIQLFGQLHLRAASRSALAFLPERFLPPHYLSGADFLGHAAKLHQHSYDPSRINHILAVLNFDEGALKRSVRSYSKGMTQKLGLTATFLAERPLYILDEPMSGLDPQARAGVKRLLSDVRKAGKAVFLTSHALPEIEEICDRVIVLHHGVPYFAGPPSRLCQDYSEVSIEQAFLRCIETAPHGRTEQQALTSDRR
ncbi:MAG: ABC transporter ATP-binding protein [Betaproteobacteria bacterium]|nr:ABC transporter ATP-binding protein [Betaproteobacteria bacterium]